METENKKAETTFAYLINHTNAINVQSLDIPYSQIEPERSVGPSLQFTTRPMRFNSANLNTVFQIIHECIYQVNLIPLKLRKV